MAPDKIKVNSQTISNEQEIASMFNNYFTDIGKNLADKIDTSNKHPFDHYLHSPSISKFQFKQTNPNEIISVINNLPMKTSSGHDTISCIILKEIKDIIAQPLSLVVNQAFNTGVFPSKLKLAKVIPLYKKGDKTSIENYRPISLLPCMSKVLEKIINIQLYDYFQSNHLLYKSQYGFRKHHSTEFASLELVDTIQQQLDLKLDPFAVFLDMSKAFDVRSRNSAAKIVLLRCTKHIAESIQKLFIRKITICFNRRHVVSPPHNQHGGTPRIDPGTTPVYNIH